MLTREEKLTRAKEIIAASPAAGRRAIAKVLRLEMGKGLRDAVILSLQREAYPERRRIIVEPYQLAEPLERRYRPLKQGRYNKLVKMNFSAEEARKLSNLPLTRLPFLKNMAKSRKELTASITNMAEQLGWGKKLTQKELKALIDYTYKDSGWADAEGKHNPFSMVRQFRREAIDAGLWDPEDSPWRKKPRVRKKVFGSRWKGDVVGQHTRYRRLHKDVIKESKARYRQKQKEKAK